MGRWAQALYVTTALSLLAPTAWAQGSGDSERLYKEGWRLYQSKQYDEACPLLERSLAAAPTLRTRGALALCYEGQTRWASAYKTWKAVAEQAKQEGAVEAQRMKRANQKVAELAAKVAQVVFQVAPGTPDVKVALDGQQLAAADLGTAVAIDPGSHTVDATASDRVPWHGTFELGKTDEGKTRSFPVGPLQSIERVPNAEIPVGPTGPESVPMAPARPPKPPMPTLKIVGLVAAGAGVAALAVGTIFAIKAHSDWSSAKDMGCDDSGVCRTMDAANLVNDAGSHATIGTIGISAGLVLIAGGAALWFFTPTPEVEKPGVTPSVSVGPGGAQLGLVGRF
jgi:hypothetical protein